MADRSTERGGIDRRGFFKIVGVSGAAAVAAGCGKTTETLLPYVIPPDNLVPGVATWYGTVCRESPEGCCALAKVWGERVVTRKGRCYPPENRRALCARCQAAE